MVASRAAVLMLLHFLAVVSSTNMSRWKANNHYQETTATSGPSPAPLTSPPTTQQPTAVPSVNSRTFGSKQRRSSHATFYGWSLMVPLVSLSLVGWFARRHICACGDSVASEESEVDLRAPPIAEIEFTSSPSLTSDLGDGSAAASSYVHMADEC